MNGLRAYLLTAPQRQTLQAYGAAKVVDRGKTLGQFRDGFRADLVAWNPTEIMPYGRDILRSEDPKLVLSRLIYRGAKARVETVLVNGSRVDGEKL
jgi:cytosine/adenosine deaminase-related metal-dependent hydrolase